MLFPCWGKDEEGRACTERVRGFYCAEHWEAFQRRHGGRGGCEHLRVLDSYWMVVCELAGFLAEHPEIDGPRDFRHRVCISCGEYWVVEPVERPAEELRTRFAGRLGIPKRERESAA